MLSSKTFPRVMGTCHSIYLTRVLSLSLTSDPRQ